MDDLPEGWARTQLGALVTLRGQKLDPSSMPGVPFIGLEDIEPHTSRLLKIGKADQVTSSVTAFKAGDVLYSRLRPYLNKVAIAPFDGVASAEVLSLVPTDATTAEFIQRRIMASDFLDFTALLDKGDRPRVNFKDLATFPIALPPLREQRRITEKISDLNTRLVRAGVELARVPVLVANYKRRLLELAFRGKLTEDMRTGQYATTPRVDDLPAGWVVKPLGEIGDIQGGIQVGKRRTAPVELVEVPYLRVANVQRGWLDLSEVKTIAVTPSERDRLALREGDILMNEGGDRDKLGRGWIWNGQIPGCIHQNHVFRIRLREGAPPPEFVSHYANEHGQRYFIEQGTQTTNLASISKSKVASLPVPVPPLDEAAEIVRRIRSAFAWLDHMSADVDAATQLLHRLTGSILSAAAVGRLVSQDAGDEPASELLSRVEGRPNLGLKAGRARRTVKEHGEGVNVTDSLREVLAAADGWISAQEAFRRCGITDGTPTDRVEAIYTELRALDQEGRLDIQPVSDSQGRKLYDQLKLSGT